jgi:hypothetical protein
MNRSAKLLVAATIAILGASATTALADSGWDRFHPRRDQVNDRLAMQSFRINHQVREARSRRGRHDGCARPTSRSAARSA